MRNTMGRIDKHSVMTKVGAHVCGCKVASLNARNMCYFFAWWHQVVFVKRQGPLYAPPRAIATMVFGVKLGEWKKHMDDHNKFEVHCKDK